MQSGSELEPGRVSHLKLRCQPRWNRVDGPLQGGDGRWWYSSVSHQRRRIHSRWRSWNPGHWNCNYCEGYNLAGIEKVLRDKFHRGRLAYAVCSDDCAQCKSLGAQLNPCGTRDAINSANPLLENERWQRTTTIYNCTDYQLSSKGMPWLDPLQSTIAALSLRHQLISLWKGHTQCQTTVLQYMEYPLQCRK